MVLDATLALFQRLPTKANAILGRLRGSAAGLGRSLVPDFAAWLDDDVLLDRCLHVERLSGEGVLSSAIREDFDHASRTRGERLHLESLPARSIPQQGRLDAIRGRERTLAGSPRGRTRRRIAERIERLLPIAYRNELDATFRQILREAWKIDVPKLTPAWRDAVRFWLVVDDNRMHLGALLKAAADCPGKGVKLHFTENTAWIERARKRIDVDTWLAPHRTSFHHEGAPFVVELEEDPLEVLRMGIPFGTCLALDSGCNAASTVLNALEANKRVVYVRNEAGRIVGRKLLAMTTDFTIVGYNLYVSAAGSAGAAIRTAVLATCGALSRATRAPLAATGEPEQLMKGFWYDDGTVPFGDESDDDVPAYCASLGLPETTSGGGELRTEARGWRACQEEDLDAAISTLNAWQSGPAARMLGSWVIDRLGRAAEKRASCGPSDLNVFVPLLHSLAETEHGMIRALDLAGRFPEGFSQQRLGPLVARFPPSPRLAVALVELATRSVRRRRRTTNRGLVHLTLSLLPTMLDDVASAFDVLDAITPAWDHLASVVPQCHPCIAAAEAAATAAVLALFRHRPDADVVVATLMSRRRSPRSHAIALRIAARHELPRGDRATCRRSRTRGCRGSTARAPWSACRRTNRSSLTMPNRSSKRPRNCWRA